MSTITTCTVLAVYADHGKAEAAIDELIHAGFSKEEIGLAAPGGPFRPANTPTEAAEEKAAKGAVVGGVTGSICGALAGALVMATVPGLGLILAGGILAGIIGGGATGAALGVFAGPFVAMGLSEREARHYEKELRRGRTIVAVRPAEREDRALTILRRHGPLQVEVVATADVT